MGTNSTKDQAAFLLGHGASVFCFTAPKSILAAVSFCPQESLCFKLPLAKDAGSSRLGDGCSPDCRFSRFSLLLERISVNPGQANTSIGEGTLRTPAGEDIPQDRGKTSRGIPRLSALPNSLHLRRNYVPRFPDMTLRGPCVMLAPKLLRVDC